ncbi:MAG: hypothetical protein ACI9PP_002001, partial [Halobacteriales archaeon]
TIIPCWSRLPCTSVPEGAFPVRAVGSASLLHPWLPVGKGCSVRDEPSIVRVNCGTSEPPSQTATSVPTPRDYSFWMRSQASTQSSQRKPANPSTSYRSTDVYLPHRSHFMRSLSVYPFPIVEGGFNSFSLGPECLERSFLERVLREQRDDVPRLNLRVAFRRDGVAFPFDADHEHLLGQQAVAHGFLDGQTGYRGALRDGELLRTTFVSITPGLRAPVPGWRREISSPSTIGPSNSPVIRPCQAPKSSARRE